MPDPLGKLRALAERLDRERARPSRIEPDRLILAQRPPATTRRICLDCRQQPTYEAYRTRWLADNPPPPAECIIAKYGDTCSDWKQLGGKPCSQCLSLVTSRHLRGLPPFALIEQCPTCRGQLVTVTS